MAKKAYTFSLESEFILKAKEALKNDKTLKYSSFNHFVEVAIRREYLSLQAKNNDFKNSN